MIADLQLTGEHYGALVFAFQNGEVKGKSTSSLGKSVHDVDIPELPVAATDNSNAAGWLYQVLPRAHSAQYIQHDIKINTWRVQPEIATQEVLQGLFTRLLDSVHTALQKRVELKCRGIFLDSLSANGQGELAAVLNLSQRDGQDWSAHSLDELLLCPKLHVAPWRVDLVSLDDCCVNKKLCHITGNAGSRKPQRLTRLEDIKEAIETSRTTTDDNGEAVAQAATRQVLIVTKRYTELLQPDMDVYLQRVRVRLDIDDLFDTSPLLDAVRRENLALGLFLSEQVEYIKSTNYTGPARLWKNPSRRAIVMVAWRDRDGFANRVVSGITASFSK